MKNSRLIGGKPKIGIRPIIDGRRGGIRESLEDMTMTMARKVAELYSSELYHSDGTPVMVLLWSVSLLILLLAELQKLLWQLRSSVIME